MPNFHNDSYPKSNQENWLIGWTDYIIDLYPNQYVLRKSSMNIFDSQYNPFCYYIRDQSNKICAGLDINLVGWDVNLINICIFDSGNFLLL